MALLPKELSGSDKRSRVFKLPTNNVSPLVELEGQVSMGFNPISVGWVHNGFTRWPNGNRLSQIATP